MASIDETDKKIIAEYLKDARVSYREVAKRLQLAVGTVLTRTKKLENDGIIESYSAILNHDKLGYEIGAKATIRDFKKDLTYLQNIYGNDYEEDIYAAYTSLTYDITDRFGIKAGARFEQVETNASLAPSNSNITPDSVNIISTIIDNAVEDSPYKNPYSKVYPSVILIYKLSPMQTIQFGYSKKLNTTSRRT